jgi:hypothetical protein
MQVNLGQLDTWKGSYTEHVKDVVMVELNPQRTWSQLLTWVDEFWSWGKAHRGNGQHLLSQHADFQGKCKIGPRFLIFS